MSSVMFILLCKWIDLRKRLLEAVESGLAHRDCQTFRACNKS